MQNIFNLKFVIIWFGSFYDPVTVLVEHNFIQNVCFAGHPCV